MGPRWRRGRRPGGCWAAGISSTAMMPRAASVAPVVMAVQLFSDAALVSWSGGKPVHSRRTSELL